MLSKPTVLILGAGASQPYGYPVAGELKNRIVQGLTGGSDTPLMRTLKALKFGDTEIRGFGGRLNAEGVSSIDDFLDTSGEYLQIGKASIAHEIMSAEAASASLATLNPLMSGDWYSHLWSLIRPDSSPESLRQNELAIVTFNYDRSFECFFTNAIRTAFGLSWDDAERVFRESLPCIHLHGVVGALSELCVTPQLPSPQAVQEAAGQIRVVPERELETDPGFQKAWKYLMAANHIGIIGFRYHPTNVRRLRLLDICHWKRGKRVFASAYKMSLKEVADAEACLGLGGEKLRLGRIMYRDLDALSFLQNVPVLEASS